VFDQIAARENGIKKAESEYINLKLHGSGAAHAFFASSACHTVRLMRDINSLAVFRPHYFPQISFILRVERFSVRRYTARVLALVHNK
jgi:hypothetical protein